MKRTFFFLAFILVSVLGFSQSPWAGEWTTKRDGEAITLKITVNGGDVTAILLPKNIKAKGTLEDENSTDLFISWNNKSTGMMNWGMFTLSDDQKSFTGECGEGENPADGEWNGTKKQGKTTTVGGNSKFIGKWDNGMEMGHEVMTIFENGKCSFVEDQFGETTWTTWTAKGNTLFVQQESGAPITLKLENGQLVDMAYKWTKIE